MTQYERSTCIASAIAALTLFPGLALAGGESGEKASHGTQTEARGSQGSAAPADPDMRSAPDTRGNIDLDDLNMNMHADPVTPAPSARPSAAAAAPSGTNPNGTARVIDPSELEKVFGTDAAVVDLKLLSTAQVRALQQTLQQRGHYRGPLDGRMGPKTRAAMTGLLAEQFALEQRLLNQGQITDQLASRIGVSTTDKAPVNGKDTSAPTGSNPQRQPETAPQPSNARQQPLR
jgi:hypothetical protein